MSHGRLKNTIKMIALTFVFTTTAQAAVAIRDISVDNARDVGIQLDSPIKARAIQTEYLRDIVQITLEGATIYPAKIENFMGGSFSKVFAYQYSPNMVRIRFTVPDDAETYRGKIKVSASGKSIQINFPEASAAPVAKDEVAEANETKLLNKVLGRKPSENVDAPTTGFKKEKSQSMSTAPLAGRKEGASPLRAIFIMMIIVGGLGLFLFWIKRKAGKSQVSSKGGWLANLIPAHMKKQKGFIEVLATTPLGPKQNILLVRIRGQQLVLGVTQDRIQLITQLDTDRQMDSDWEGDLLEDPNVSESLSKMFGASVQTQEPAPVARSTAASAYTKPFSPSITVASTSNKGTGTFRDEIRKRMEGMRSL